MTSRQLRMAIVHEWVDAFAGSEQVFEAMAQAFPHADLFALSHNRDVTLEVGERPITTTVLDTPFWRRRRALSLPLMPLAWRLLGKRDYDVVLTSHHAFAHSNRLSATDGRLFSYVHSPARYIWTPELDNRGSARSLAPARKILQAADRRSVKRVDSIAANSTTVRDRICRFWQRDARVIFPPVRTEFFGHNPPRERARNYLLGVGRWVPYKNLHLVIAAADLLGMPVKIAGAGPDDSRIREEARRASVQVELIEAPSHETLRNLYQHARCLVFPTIEDFGIIPVEAQAAGTPVVGPNRGGVRDTVAHLETGVLVDSLDPQVLAHGVTQTEGISTSACAANASRFAPPVFINAMRSWIREELRPT